MKNLLSRILAVLIVLFTLPTSIALPETLRMNYNPVLLNGQSVSYERLTTATRGTLTMVLGNPESAGARRVPFNIYLVRAGKMVDTGWNVPKQPVMEYELAKILSSAKVDDLIVMDPVDKEIGIGQRIITVDRFQLMPQFNWLIGLTRPNKGGC